MSGLSIQLKMDASGYTSGIKQAGQATKEFTNQITQTTKNLPNAKREMVQLKREATNLAVAIQSMSEAERSSAEGQAMVRHLQELRERGAVLIDTIGDINAEMRAMASDTSGLDAAGQALGVFGNTLSSVAGIIGLVTGEEEKMKKAVVMFTTVQSVLNTVTQISNALNKSSILVLKTKAIQQKAATVATKLETAAQSQNIVVSKAATVAMKAFNAAAKANPIGLLITALTTVIGLFALFTSKSDEATDAMGEQKESARRLAEEHTHAQQTIATRIADTTGKFVELAVQWRMLKTEAQQLAWIENNKSAFQQLGLNIKSVTDAQEVFIRQLPKVLNVLKIQAEAAANLDLYIEQYKKRQERLADPNLGNGGSRQAPEKTWNKILGGVGGYSEYNSSKRQSALADIAATYGLIAGEDYNVIQGTGVGETYFDQISTLTKKGQDKLKKITNEAALQRQKIRENEEDEAMKTYLRGYEERTREAERLRSELPQMYDPSSSRNPYNTKTPKTTKPKPTKTDKPTKSAEDKKSDVKEVKSAREQELDALNKKEKSLIDQMYVLERANKKDTQEYRNKQTELNNVRQRIEDINNIGKSDNANEIQSSIDKQKEYIKTLEEQKALLQGEDGNVKPGKETEWNELTTKITEANTLLDYMQAQLDGVKLTKLDELKKEFDDIKDKYEKALENDPEKKLDTTKQLETAYKKAYKEYNDLKDKVEKELEVTVDIKEQYLQEKIDKIQEEIENIDLELELNLELNALDKGKLQNQKDEYQRELNKWQKQLNQQKGIVDEEDFSWNNTNDPYQLKTVTAAGKLQNLDVEIGKIDWSKAAEGIEQDFGLTSIMSDKMKMLYDTKTTTSSNVGGAINEVRNAYKNGIFGDGKEAREQAQKYIDQLNDYLQNVGLDPIEVNLKTDDFRAKIGSAMNTIGQLGNAVEQAFDAMNQLFKVDNEEDNKSMQVGKIIAQTLATLALSFAQAMTQEKTGVWGWIAGGIAGMAQLIAMTAQIKEINKSSGYASGGVVGGHSYYGDKILARVNSGEMISNSKQQKQIWQQMNNRETIYSPLNPELHGNITITGDQLNIALTNRERKINKRR